MLAAWLHCCMCASLALTFNALSSFIQGEWKFYIYSEWSSLETNSWVFISSACPILSLLTRNPWSRPLSSMLSLEVLFLWTNLLTLMTFWLSLTPDAFKNIYAITEHSLLAMSESTTTERWKFSVSQRSKYQTFGPRIIRNTLNMLSSFECHLLLMIRSTTTLKRTLKKLSKILS